MKKLIQIPAIGAALTISLAAYGMYEGPIVQVTNNTKGKVKFSVDATGGGNHDMWVDPGTNKSYDSNGLALETVKIRYYPADGSEMLSYDKEITAGRNTAGWTWTYSVFSTGIGFESSNEAGAGALTMGTAGGLSLNDFYSENTYYWPVTVTNNSPYIAIASWDDGFRVIEPGAEDTIKSGTIKLFEKEDNPVALTKDDLNKKTLEINGSEAAGFSLQGSGNATGSDSSRTYKNNTDNWVTYDYKKNANEWHLLKGADAQGNSEADKNVSVRVYTKEKGSIDFTKKLQDTESSTWVIDKNGDINPA